MQYSDWLDTAAQLDDNDPLRVKRMAFCLPNDVVYLDGNSLGPVSYAGKEAAFEVIEGQWQPDLIQSWNQHEWIDLPQRVGAQLAPLLGAQASEVICADSISVNLHKLLPAALALNPSRNVVVTQADNFPTDGYMVQGLQQLHPELTLEDVAEQDIIAALTPEVAVLLLTEVNYRSGYRHDIAALTRAAHQQGIVVIWDLAHSAGLVPLSLHQWDVDFAVGCGYKYLNGGPGAPAFMFVHEKHHQHLQQPLTGWMGHQAPFAFSREYAPAKGVAQLQCGTPAIISMATLSGALTIYDDIDMQQVLDKSLALSKLFVDVCAHLPSMHHINWVTDMDDTRRGGHIALAHEHAYAICQAWIAQGVIADFRAPNILRIGFAPLYLGYADIVKAAFLLAEVIGERSYLDPVFQIKQTVT